MTMDFAWQNDFNIGQGFDLVTGARVKSGKAGFDPPELPHKGGTEADVVTKHVDDMYLIVSKQNSTDSLTAALNVAGKGIGWNAKVDAELTSVSKHSARSISAMRQIRVGGFPQQVPSTQRLSGKAAALLAKSHDDFRAEYGTHFIAGVISGASFVGNVDNEFDSVEKKMDVSATLSGSVEGGVVQAKAQASVDAAMKDMSTRATTTCHAIAVGGTVREWGMLNFASWEELEEFANSYLTLTTADSLVPMYAIVEPWSMLDEVPTEVSLVGPDDVDTDELIKAVPQEMTQLHYVSNSLSGSDPRRRQLDHSMQAIAAALTGYLHAEPDGLPTAHLALKDELDAAEVEIGNLGIIDEFAVEFVCQYQVSHRSRTKTADGVTFHPNDKYPTLRVADGTIAVPAGKTVNLAEFSTAWKDMVASIRVTYVGGQPQVQAYFGRTANEDGAFAGADSDGAVATAARSTDGRKSGWTAKAHTPTVDDQHDNCYLLARLNGPA